MTITLRQVLLSREPGIRGRVAEPSLFVNAVNREGLLYCTLELLLGVGGYLLEPC